ncbi:hypothetical protein FLAV_00647 [Flavobacteriales bacterium]|nr:hypothetical protein [Flavobacteriales bacterium]WKZ75003.1 MAG: hypothetical protein QY303_12740 [Vicingaceae bacterium]GIK69945.1 MAG: hypothetical protein BroJett020_12400 [Bacteroidota bacterium]MCL4815384.1 hypothetical protein [Flavobacteriales bacterium]NUM49826.1 hypothetical protein [Flavobacteriales bacterium]
MVKKDIEFRWKEVEKICVDRFGEKLDATSLLFIIGLQELAKPPQLFSKDQKLDIIHIALCKVLEPFGYYTYKGLDEEGWPHWERTKKLPFLNPEEQEILIKEAIADYMQI